MNAIKNIHNDFEIYQFNKGNGLVDSDCRNRCILIDKNNNLWLGTSQALAVLDLNNYDFPKTTESPQLLNLKINEKHYNYSSDSISDKINFDFCEPFYNFPRNLSLSHEMNNLTFEYSTSRVSVPHQVVYSHRLKGASSQWSSASKSSSASYRGLFPGVYTFEVVSAGLNKEWSKPIQYTFEIRPPWWLSTWAKLSYVILGSLLIILIFRLRTSHLKKRQDILELEVASATEEIRLQKDEIEEHHKEIKDSIEYAKRIQNAILPSPSLINELLKNSFILYKPKDIVAGDFYWIERQNNKILFAAADCTGHGVPGALVSVICNGALNRAVKEFKCLAPGEILDKVRDLIIEEFEKSEEEVKDGMDIALCALEGNKLSYAGAHNPLWIIRKNSTEVEEIKADKQPVGKYDIKSPFNSHETELNSGDTLYIFSDGFADQFGGEKGKKFKSKNFKNLLLSIQNETIEMQHILINDAFENWRGSLEQLDDVCVIGIRI